MRLDAAGDFLRLTWDIFSCSSNDYNLLYGDLPEVGGYVLSDADCLIGTEGKHTWFSVPPGDLYFLIVGTDDEGTESSRGKNPVG